METKFYFSFLTFCAIFSQGIGILNESMKFLVRQKHIVDNTPSGGRSVPIEEVYYIVNIEMNGFRHCGGSILLPHIIITAAHCFSDTNATFNVLSGTNKARGGQRHIIRNKLIYDDYVSTELPHDLALIEIDPPIGLPNRKILLHSGHLRPGDLGTVSGWGCFYLNGNKARFPHTLRSIVVPIISLEECQEAFRNISHAHITNQEICTLDASGQKCTGYGDSGGPLVVNEHLVGVMSRTGKHGLFPDVFTNLAYPEYRTWITRHLSPHSSHSSHVE